jgi:hypothetical protein
MWVRMRMRDVRGDRDEDKLINENDDVEIIDDDDRDYEGHGQRKGR